MLPQSEIIYFTSEILKCSLKFSIQTFLIGIIKMLILQKIFVFILKYS